MAEAAGLPAERLMLFNLALIGHNLDRAGLEGSELDSDGLRRDGLAEVGCVQAAVTAARNGGRLLHAANEDWPMALRLGNALPRVALLRRPESGHPHLLFGVPGQLGGLNGVNARGLAVSSASLADCPSAEDGPGLFHPVLVARLLAGAADIDEALAMLAVAPLTGQWSLCLSHAPTDRIVHAEYRGHRLASREATLVRTANHSEFDPGEPPPDSLGRRRRLEELLPAPETSCWTVELLQAALRDRFDASRGRVAGTPSMQTVLRADNQISLVMAPGSGDAWVTPGPAARGNAARFCRLDLDALLAAPPAAPLAEGRLMSRFVLRLADAPLPHPAAPGRRHDAAFVLGGGAEAAELRERLRAGGCHVHDIAEVDCADAACDALEAAFYARPATLLVLTHARAPTLLDGSAGLAERIDAGLLLPYRLAQRWAGLVEAAGHAAGAALLATSGLGGDLGLTGGGAGAWEGGGMAGLLKAIRREMPALQLRLLDAPADEAPATLAAQVLEELAAETREIEIARRGARRQRIRAVPRRAEPLPGLDIAPGSVWVVSGGARGITALAALELGRRFDLDLHLLGRTPPVMAIGEEWLDLPAEELRRRAGELRGQLGAELATGLAEWRDLQAAVELRRRIAAFALAGVRARYYVCDVTDAAALAGALAAVRAASGPVQGVLHGAGIELASRFAAKHPRLVAATLRTKLAGCELLAQLTRDDPLAFFIAFGSISGRFGGLGQTDYAMASDALARRVAQLRFERPVLRAVTIDWPAWDEAGMSVRPETRVVLDAAGFSFMPAREGAAHLLDELRAGAPEPEVVILDDDRGIDLDGIMPDPEARQATDLAQARAGGVALLQGVVAAAPGRARLEQLADPRRHAFLDQHRLRGVALLPSVAGIEAIAEAVALATGRTPRLLRDVDILTACRFAGEAALRLEIDLEERDDGWSALLRGPFRNRSGGLVDDRRTYLRAGAALQVPPPGAGWPDPPAGKPDAGAPFDYPDAPAARAAGVIEHGPAFRRLTHLCIDGDAGSGRIVAGPPDALGGRPGRPWLLPAAEFDACLVACAAHAAATRGHAQLPVGFRRIVIGPRLPAAGEELMVQLRRMAAHETGMVETGTVYDFRLLGADGTTLLDVAGHDSAIPRPAPG